VERLVLEFGCPVVAPYRKGDDGSKLTFSEQTTDFDIHLHLCTRIFGLRMGTSFAEKRIQEKIIIFFLGAE
jgi:hypothetical protein